MSGTPAADAPSVIPGASAELTGRLLAGLAEVNTLFEGVLQSEDGFITEASGHLAGSGKRFRPLLTLLAAELGTGRDDQVVKAATAVELIHMASLYHDDVMDEAELRRAVVSANARYGNSTAILIGDLLFGRASALVADLGPEAVRIQADTFVRLCSGQIRDDRPCPDGVEPVGYYLDVLADKTGGLIATAARYGAMFAGCEPHVVEIMRRYGEQLGIAFQLADDLLDIAAESEQSGKTPGTDLREGVRTLPVLYALASSDPADARLQELLRSDLSEDDAGVEEALTLLRAHPALEEARRYTHAVAQEAQDLLTPLGDNEVTQALRTVAAGVVDRVV
ncbi:polyprenyl synthetase family protein [Arsenicicoccus piscis]|uniref:Geranylgeranyl pyrophosphate synthase n=1 Tax=Arsenicicoccus piscis TaxID=673954 RepID=A0ABQ6HI70_9MICO|nr:polyprenyl synthetase family protein [Arsenicicoccus piscis]MCH8627740.1 polyprenyl synthetase family protein [Arsenicicoccus piscis]GMA18251.1 geranylgeranyl pyrophosphate synthase [Arsenicicoccus piscis]